MAIAALSTPAPRADLWFRPPSNDDQPAGPRGCRWRMVIDTCKSIGWQAGAVWFSKQKLAGRGLDDCLDQMISTFEASFPVSMGAAR